MTIKIVIGLIALAAILNFIFVVLWPRKEEPVEYEEDEDDPDIEEATDPIQPQPTKEPEMAHVTKPDDGLQAIREMLYKWRHEGIKPKLAPYHFSGDLRDVPEPIQRSVRTNGDNWLLGEVAYSFYYEDLTYVWAATGTGDWYCALNEIRKKVDMNDTVEKFKEALAKPEEHLKRNWIVADDETQSLFIAAIKEQYPEAMIHEGRYKYFDFYKEVKEVIDAKNITPTTEAEGNTGLTTLLLPADITLPTKVDASYNELNSTVTYTCSTHPDNEVKVIQYTRKTLYVTKGWLTFGKLKTLYRPKTIVITVGEGRESMATQFMFYTGECTVRMGSEFSLSLPALTADLAEQINKIKKDINSIQVYRAKGRLWVQLNTGDGKAIFLIGDSNLYYRWAKNFEDVKPGAYLVDHLSADLGSGEAITTVFGGTRVCVSSI